MEDNKCYPPFFTTGSILINNNFIDKHKSFHHIGANKPDVSGLLIAATKLKSFKSQLLIFRIKIVGLFLNSSKRFPIV